MKMSKMFNLVLREKDWRTNAAVGIMASGLLGLLVRSHQVVPRNHSHYTPAGILPKLSWPSLILRLSGV
jgi:hypothetical protein